MLYKLSDFIDNNYKSDDSVVSYWYQGLCPVTGSLLKLPRTQLSEAVAYGLMKQLEADELYSYEGKMYGVLLVETSSSQIQVLKAFSGLLLGKSCIEGWVGSIEGRNALMLEETYTLNLLEEIKQNILSLQTLTDRYIYQNLSEEFAQKLDQLTTTHQHNKQQRHQKRERLKLTFKGEILTQALEELNQQSRLEKIERRQLKHQRDETLNPLLEKISSADEKIRHLKQRRKILSRQLQHLMSANYSITNFRGESLSLQQLGALPTGTGECCAPKLLHYAATHHLTPVAMAEFWWGSTEPKNDRIQGKFYPACVARCQPIMGFLLSGLPEKKRLLGIL